MYRNALWSLTVVVAACGVTACYESPEVTMYEPGVYKGSADPLLEDLRSRDAQQTLRERFDLVQRDR